MVRISTGVMVVGAALFFLPLPLVPPLISGIGVLVFIAGAVLRFLGM